MDEKQKKIMRWILFATILILFIVISGFTIYDVFFATKSSLNDKQRDLLFNTFLVAVGTALFSLFYAIFDLKIRGGNSAREYKIRLNFEELIDIKSFFGKEVVCTPIVKNNEVYDDISCFIIDERGPVINITPPKNTKFVLISFAANSITYSGSFALDSYMVDMKGEDQ